MFFKGSRYRRMVFFDGMQTVDIYVRNIGERKPDLSNPIIKELFEKFGEAPMIQMYGWIHKSDRKRRRYFEINIPAKRAAEFIRLVSDPKETEIDIELKKDEDYGKETETD